MTATDGTLCAPKGLLAGLPRLGRQDWWILLVLFALGLGSNLIPGQKTFSNSDQAELAFALEDYDVGVEHPHPPGNPAFVACAKVIYLITGDALLSLRLVCGALRVGAILGLYWLAALLYGRQAAIAASSLWVFLPVLWNVGVTTFTWVSDAFFTVFIAATALKAHRGSNKYAVLSAALLALGMGFRESVALLGLLWLYSCWRRPARVIVLAALVAAVIVVIWAGGMILATGSWDRYMTSRQAIMQEAIRPTTVLFSGKPVERLQANLEKLMDCTLGYGSRITSLFWLLPMIYALGRAFSFRSLAGDFRAMFLAIWWLPAIVFYTLFHIVHTSHALLFLPAWIIIAGVGIVLIAADLKRPNARRPGSFSRPAFVVMTGGAMVFYLGVIGVLGPRGIARGEAETGDIVGFIEDNFEPDECFLVQAKVRRQFRAVMYNLRDYQGAILQQTFGPTARPSMSMPSPIELGPGVKYLVVPEILADIYMPTKTRTFKSSVAVRWRRLAPEERYLFFDARGLWTSADPTQTEPPAPAPIPSEPAVGPGAD